MSPSRSTAARPTAVAAVQARHATALRSYVIELVHGDTARADAILLQVWTTLSPEAEPEAAGAAALFATARRLAGVTHRGVAVTQEGDGAQAAEDETAESRFETLTPKQLEALRLKFVFHFSHSEIAQIIELGAPQTARLLHNALTRLTPAFASSSGAAGGASDDPRVTLGALGELDTAAWRAWEAEQTDPTATNQRLEETRRAAQWVADYLVTGRSSPRTRTETRRPGWRLALAMAAFGALVLVGWWMLRDRAPAPVAINAAPAAGLTGAERITPAIGAAAPSLLPDAAGARGTSEDVRFLGVVRDTPHAPGRPAVAPERSAPATDVARALEPTAARRGSIAQDPLAEPAAVQAGDVGPSNGRREDARPIASAATASVPAILKNDDKIESLVRSAEGRGRLRSVDSTSVAPIVALKRALDQGRWPDVQNSAGAALTRYFANRPSSNPPAPGVLVSSCEASVLPWSDGRVMVRVAATARRAAERSRAPVSVIILMDVSASMAAPNRLPLVQEAVRAVLERLGPDDRVGLVTYAGESAVLAVPARLGDSGTLPAQVSALEAKGQTNGGAGLIAAFELAAREPRGEAAPVVILCTDGEFNMGITTEGELGRLVEGHAAQGVRLAVFGFGRSDRIDPRLELLAAVGHGSSGYVNTRADAVTMISAALGELIRPVVTDVEMRSVRVADEVGIQRRSQLLPGESIVRCITVPNAATRVSARINYRLADSHSPASADIVWDGQLTELTATSPDFRFDAAVERLAALLEGSPAASVPHWNALEQWVRTLVDDTGGYRAELLALIAHGRKVAGAVAP